MTAKTRATRSATPEEGAAAEVPFEIETTVVLPGPDRALGLRAGKRTRSAEVATTPAEARGRARRPAARDTAVEVAEPAAVTPNTPPRRKPAPNKAHSPKAGAAKASPAAKPTPGSLRVIGDGWLAALRAAGHSTSTVASYGRDLEVAYAHFEGTKAATQITDQEIAAFETSKAVTRKKNGRPKAKPTILKTRRALRLALVWAEQKGLLKKAPYAD